MVHPTITQHWRDTLELLLQRKYLFHLGPRGALHILAKCIFYIAKLRHICLLAPEDRKVFKSKLRKDLALRRNFPRLSFALSFYPAQKANHQKCFKLSKQNRHGYISPVLSFPQLGDFDKIVDWMKLSLDQLIQMICCCLLLFTIYVSCIMIRYQLKILIVS